MVDASISRHGRPVDTAFDLLGQSENDLTSALGFAMSRSDRLARSVLACLGIRTEGAINVRMETADEFGRTDLELETEDALVVIEAKRGWNLPTEAQLSRYAGRVKTKGAGSLVTLSDCSIEYATQVLPPEIAQVGVRHLPWSAVKEQIATARTQARGSERLWLSELASYLHKAVRVRDPADSWAFCVSLSTAKPGGGGERTFRDFVVDEGVYFHPFGWGSGWPTVPPNFFAFRWGGRVHQVRRVLKYEVLPDLQSRWPDTPATADTTRPVIVHSLGPPLPMNGPLPSGTNYRAARLWVLVDQLLTSPTLREALENSKAMG